MATFEKIAKDHIRDTKTLTIGLEAKNSEEGFILTTRPTDIENPVTPEQILRGQKNIENAIKTNAWDKVLPVTPAFDISKIFADQPKVSRIGFFSEKVTETRPSKEKALTEEAGHSAESNKKSGPSA